MSAGRFLFHVEGNSTTSHTTNNNFKEKKMSVSQTLFVLLVIVGVSYVSADGYAKIRATKGGDKCSGGMSVEGAQISGCVPNGDGTSNNGICNSDGSYTQKTFTTSDCTGTSKSIEYKPDVCTAGDDGSYTKLQSCSATGDLPPAPSNAGGACLGTYSGDCKGTKYSYACMTEATECVGGTVINCLTKKVEVFSNNECTGSPAASKAFTVGECMGGTTIDSCGSSAVSFTGLAVTIVVVIAFVIA